MENPLREAWASLIRPADYDAHMAAVGQAEANANLVADYFREQPPAPGAGVLFAGAGTGQMFDFVSPAFLLPYRTVFADINHGYLRALAARLGTETRLPAHAVVDDIERSGLAAGFGLAVVVLVLEHVDWRRAIATLCRLSSRVLVVIQENPPETPSALAATREVPGSMGIFRSVHPRLLADLEVRFEFRTQGFEECYRAEKDVADEKRMVALGYRREGFGR